jgi:hypothetical protein
MTLAYRILRKYRGYILPSHRRAFREAVARGQFQKGDEKKRFVYFDFSSSQIDIDAGRYTFALVRDFEEAGYASCFGANFAFLSSMRYKRYKALLLEREFRVCDSIKEIPHGTLTCVVTDRARFKADGTKLLRVSYEHRLPQKPTEVVMPFRVYPQLYSQLPSLSKIDLEKPRPWRAFFAGTITSRYGRKILEKNFGKMSRLSILHTLEKDLSAHEIHLLNSFDDELPQRPLFVRASSDFRVPLEEWFATLARADFFLACPGGVMPICHNVVEAMASGAIPILEYPEYLDPPLQDGVNCLAFSGPKELLGAVTRAFQSNSSQIAPMRRAARQYYERHLAPGIFANAVIQSQHPELTLLFNNAHVPR